MANTHSLDLERSSSQYASIADGDQTGLDLSTDFTFELWIKVEQLPSTAGGTFGLISKDDVASRAYGFYFSSDDKLHVEFFSAASAYTQGVTDSAFLVGGDVGSWVHVATSMDISGPTAVFYKNASSVASSMPNTAATSIRNSTSIFTIGALASVSNFFDGLIDEARVWNDIRTGGEITSNYLKELAGTEAGSVGYWKLNNDYTDSQTSGNNDLTGQGAPVFSTDVPFVGVGETSAFLPLL